MRGVFNCMYTLHMFFFAHEDRMTEIQEYYPLNIFKDEKFAHVIVLSISMCADRMHAWCPQRPKEGIGSHGNGVTDGYELLCDFWNRTQVH